MIVLIGKSATGKTTLENILAKKGFEKILSTTTRKKRKGEQDGREYRFLEKRQFYYAINRGEVFEYTEYNNNFYGVLYEDMKINNVVFVTNFDGLHALEKAEIEHVTFYLNANVLTRIYRMLKRGDGIINAVKRILVDRKYGEYQKGMIFVDTDVWSIEFIKYFILSKYRSFKYNNKKEV